MAMSAKCLFYSQTKSQKLGLRKMPPSHLEHLNVLYDSMQVVLHLGKTSGSEIVDGGSLTLCH